MRVIIIGATSGIGKALALEYLSHGHRVGITGRRRQLLDQLEQEYPQQLSTECFDVRSDDSIRLLQALIDKLGGMDLLIYNAGYGDVSKQLSIDVDRATYETNVKGFVDLVNFAYNFFLAQGHGHIAATSSVASIRGNSWSPAYSASKAFMSVYLEGLNMKIRKQRLPIYVTDIQPGFIDTKPVSNPRFWVSSASKAAKQIYQAIGKKKFRVYVSRRWWVIAKLIKYAPSWLYYRLG